MSRFEDELKQTLRRKEPPADFAARVMSRIHNDARQATVHHMPLRTRKAYGPRLLAIAATIALLLLAGAAWLLLRQQQQSINKSPVVDNATPPPPQDKEQAAGPIEKPPVTAPEGEFKKHPSHQTAKATSPARKRSRVNEPQLTTTFTPERETFTASENLSEANPLLDDETALHLRKAQLLLRSFRNAAVAADEKTVDIAYEKQLSRELLGDNMLYRREAETRKNLPVKEVLSSLEPFLLDIANLSETPSADEMSRIKERMSKKEIVAELQVYTARAATVSLAEFK